MSFDAKIGGFPIEWFVKAPSENFKCGICLDVLKNPHQCKNGHTYCHSCISLALEKHSKCPTCKTVLSLESLCINLQLRNLIDETFVKCCHDAGCEWTGTLEQSEKHFQLCSTRSVPCPLYAHRVCTDKNCIGNVKRKDVNNHVSGGSKRDVADAMLIMAETIAYQKKEIEMLHNLCLNSEARIHTLDDESTFVGILEDGVGEGCGLVKFPNGNTYSGHFNNGFYSGFGVLRLNQCVKAGEWENGKLNGHCMVRRPQQIEGETLENCTSVATYIGDFKDNRKHGLGRIVYTKATWFGSFENDLAHGEFTSVYPNGDVLECTHENNTVCITASCTLNFGNGSAYVGTLNEHHHFAEGKYTNITGVVYEGTFCENANQFRLNGTGTITYTDGSIYTGEFRSGLKHGEGTLVRSNGETHKAGEWDNDRLVRSTSTGGFRRGISAILQQIQKQWKV